MATPGTKVARLGLLAMSIGAIQGKERLLRAD